VSKLNLYLNQVYKVYWIEEFKKNTPPYWDRIDETIEKGYLGIKLDLTKTEDKAES